MVLTGVHAVVDAVTDAAPRCTNPSVVCLGDEEVAVTLDHQQRRPGGDRSGDLLTQNGDQGGCVERAAEQDLTGARAGLGDHIGWLTNSTIVGYYTVSISISVALAVIGQSYGMSFHQALREAGGDLAAARGCARRCCSARQRVRWCWSSASGC